MNKDRYIKSKLPTHEDGKINWGAIQNTEIDIVYDGEEYTLQFLEKDYSYRSQSRSYNRIFVKLKGTDEVHTIFFNGIAECKFSAILGKYASKYRYDVGDIISMSKDSYTVEKRVKVKSKNNHDMKAYDLKCNNCGTVLYSIRENHIVSKDNVACRSCGEGISYPEKFVFNFLKQANVDNLSTQYRIDGFNFRYDFYFEVNNFKYLLETHGLQHYIDDKKCIYVGLNNDSEKRVVANDNGYNLIEVDCAYSNPEYIIESLKNSDVYRLIDTDAIDIKECIRYANSKVVISMYEYWNELPIEQRTQYVYDDMAKIFPYSKYTIPVLIRDGIKNGLCKSDKSPIKLKKENNKSIPIKCMSKNGDVLFMSPSMFDAYSAISELFGEKLSSTSIFNYCKSSKPIKRYGDITLHKITWDEYSSLSEQF